MSQLVRIDDRAHDRLRRLAEQTGEPMGVVLARALEAYEERAWWASVNAAFAAGATGPEQRAEQAAWEATLGDDLHDEPPYPLSKDGLPTR